MIRYRIAAVATALVLVVVAAACGSSGPSSSSTTATQSANEVVIKNFAFVPHTITVKAGTTVTWVNEDSVVHTVVADHDTFPSSSNLNQGGKYSHTFNTPGTYPYICGVHKYMTGTVVVTG
ncbi:MAG TPA: cupredoxin domain-containing protein [Acidimicrobiales bacterium]|nr:cupredoxin domain-containing protein [Acidimicrobiales bacterium]